MIERLTSLLPSLGRGRPSAYGRLYQDPRPCPCSMSNPRSHSVLKCPFSVLRLAPVTVTASATVMRPFASGSGAAGLVTD